jgi:hypothetical protein
MEMWNGMEYYDEDDGYRPSTILDVFVILVTVGWADEVCPGWRGDAFVKQKETDEFINVQDVPTAIVLFLMDVCRVN